MIIGCHLSTAKGFATAVDNARRLGADAFQYFPKNPRSYRIKPVDAAAWAAGAAHAREAGVVTVAHSAYVTNLSTGDPTLRETTIASIVNELEICDAYGTPWLVVHCGKHMGAGEAAGRRRMVETIDAVLERFSGRCRLLLENTAGQGSELGQTVDELLALHDRLDGGERVGFCLDTCHAFAAGWLRADAVWERFLEEVGREEFRRLLAVLHLNDSKAGPGSHIDRHELLGRGQMGEQLLAQVLQAPVFRELPVLIETPVVHEDDYADEIRRARAWAKASST